MSDLLALRKGEEVMSMMTGNMRRMILSGCAGLMVVAAGLSAARADVASDHPGAILIFPKIVVDTSGVFGPPTDTEVQISNTSNQLIGVHCNIVDTTSHCLNSGAPCTASSAANPVCATAPTTPGCCPGSSCQPSWNESDFHMTLTKRQPIAFNASTGLATFPLDNGMFGPNGQSNAGSSIQPVQEDPFVGEIKCVEVDPNDGQPIIGADTINNRTGDLKGEATIVSASPDTDPPGAVDARKYNAIALQSTFNNDRDDVLVIGGPNPEYNSCPNVLILDHLFDGATVTTGTGSQTIDHTDLTVVPCSEDFALQANNLTRETLQFLVFNEFEQRFSTSTSFTCFLEVPLSDIGTRPGPSDDSSSIFNVAVEGTLGGQTRIRSVIGTDVAHGVLGVSEEFVRCESGPTSALNPTVRPQCSAAANLHFSGSRDSVSDQIILAPSNTQ